MKKLVHSGVFIFRAFQVNFEFSKNKTKTFEIEAYLIQVKLNFLLKLLQGQGLARPRSHLGSLSDFRAKWNNVESCVSAHCTNQKQATCCGRRVSNQKALRQKFYA